MLVRSWSVLRMLFLTFLTILPIYTSMGKAVQSTTLCVLVPVWWLGTLQGSLLSMINLVACFRTVEGNLEETYLPIVPPKKTGIELQQENMWILQNDERLCPCVFCRWTPHCWVVSECSTRLLSCAASRRTRFLRCSRHPPVPRTRSNWHASSGPPTATSSSWLTTARSTASWSDRCYGVRISAAPGPSSGLNRDLHTRFCLQLPFFHFTFYLNSLVSYRQSISEKLRLWKRMISHKSVLFLNLFARLKKGKIWMYFWNITVRFLVCDCDLKLFLHDVTWAHLTWLLLYKI